MTHSNSAPDGGMPGTAALKRLREIMQSAYADKPTYEGLQSDIQQRTGVRIDRRKIQRILQGKDARLSITQLDALDRYLSTTGRERLARIFDDAGVLPAIVGQRQVSVLLGSQPRTQEKRTDLSRWDALAMHELFNRLNRIGGNVRLDFSDVMFLAPEDPTRPQAWDRAQRSTEWYQLLDQSGGAIVSLGSQRACLATEVMLAKMFHVEPFAKPSNPEVALPFYFVWSRDESARMPSAFSLDPQDLRVGRRELANEIRAQQKWAFQVDGRVFELERFVKKSTTYGILAAQRRSSGAVWLVVAGLSGPGTFAAATRMHTVGFSLPPSDKGVDSAVVWMAVEATVETHAKAGDDRVVSKADVIVGPCEWAAS